MSTSVFDPRPSPLAALSRLTSGTPDAVEAAVFLGQLALTCPLDELRQAVFAIDDGATPSTTVAGVIGQLAGLIGKAVEGECVHMSGRATWGARLRERLDALLPGMLAERWRRVVVFQDQRLTRADVLQRLAATQPSWDDAVARMDSLPEAPA